MKENSIFRRFLILTVGVSILFLFGCASANPSSSQNDARVTNKRQENMQSSPKTNETISRDVEELAKNINLPVRPTEAVWKKTLRNNEEGLVPGPNDYYLSAVLKFDDADAEKITGQEKDEFEKGAVEIEEWFPEDLKKLGKDFDGEKLLSGEKYDVKKFSRAPFSNGTLVRVSGTNYFILNLYST